MIVGIVGCGAIANTIVNECISDSGIQIKYFYDTDIERAENLAQIANGVAVLRLEEMLDDVDLILESASPIALKVIALDILERGIDLMVMSVGALMDREFRNKVRKTAEAHNAKVYAPSGAIVGLDGIKAASIG